MSGQGRANYAAVAARIGGQFDDYDKLTPDIRAAYDAGADASAAALLGRLASLAAKWDANADRNQRNGQSLLDQGDEYGSEGLAVAEALGACHAELTAIIGTPEAKTGARK